jgi:hypothetical protein
MSTPTAQTQRIFVSHSNQDSAWSRGFVDALRAAGYDAWYDESALQGSDLWVARIQQELGQREVFVVILTPASVASPWVQREVQLALAANRRIVPVVHKRLSSQEVEGVGFLRIHQWVDVVGQDSQAAAKAVVAALRGLPATPGPPSEEVTRPQPPALPGAACAAGGRAARGRRVVARSRATCEPRAAAASGSGQPAGVACGLWCEWGCGLPLHAGLPARRRSM